MTERGGDHWRGMRLDAVAFAVIAAAITLTHLRPLLQCVSFGDGGAYFHFGRRVLAGDVPYRDFALSGGSLPLYVEAIVQRIVGDGYRASLYIALGLQIVRAFALWLVARHVTGARNAGFLVVFVAFDPLAAAPYHGDAVYLHAAGLFAASCLVTGRLALAGMVLGLTAWVRPSMTACLGVIALAVTVSIVVRGGPQLRRALARAWAGAAVGLVVVAGALLATGGLGDALDQVALVDPARGAGEAILGALSVGALVMPYQAWWGGLLLLVVLPAVVLAAAAYLAQTERELELASIALVAVPLGCVYISLLRYFQLDLFANLPRLALLSATVLALAHTPVQTWLGLSPSRVLALGALPLAIDASAQLLGRGGDSTVLVLGIVLAVLASTHISPRAAMLLAVALALSGLVHLATARFYGVNHVSGESAIAQTPVRATVSTKRKLLRRLRLSDARKHAVDWLALSVRSGSTCYVHGDLPVLYDVLGCRPPAGNLPPEYVLVPASATATPIMATLLASYVTLGTVGEVLGPGFAAALALEPDHMETLSVYRRLELAR